MPRPHVEEERRQQILEATWHVIAVSGFRSLRLSDVAKRAGVSSGMIHYYFDTKRDLLKAAFERYYEHSMQRRQWVMETGKGPLELLKLIVESYVPVEDETMEGWHVWSELWVEGLQEPDLQQLNEDFYGQWRRLVAGIIRDGQDAGVIRDGSATELANMLIAMMDGLAIQVLLGSRSMTAERMRTTCLAFIDEMLPKQAAR
ncbi:TetR/AcrR family transcriptional regulator [Trebonia sp.]|uniref:TetR/AcrR family transcriptional regulator n=1 Tax=Trebonia sp. TaxID=2767075 RepID=UPI002627ABB2|nr:TetR/AcrR family transcriptional regulator [Trebonia sp.]